ncbi:hypothetical protein JMJ55_18530 [Belnapia sp. T6]|uniref:Uncharacterized protein n=1 Tax=Belnapia mucosa TaxID=2804532 RepID=A0ABS1V6M6_9PROT|nr:hypothetical protein [Belnapia mucosa]MBL6457334.1 hypothetical protein [Belnapia mucosa]
MGFGTVQQDTIRWRYALLILAVVLAAVGTVVHEGWDLDRNGALCLWEALMVLVRLMAFPVHALLRLTPGPLLEAVGLPDAPWPSSALLAVGASLPLWGLLVIGGLMAEAWLELGAESGRAGPGAAQRGAKAR